MSVGAQGTQHPRFLGWEPPGLDFSVNGVWRAKARGIARRRATLLAQRDFASLNAAALTAAPLPAPTAITGTLLVPAILVRFADTDTTTSFAPTQYSSILFSTVAPGSGRPYTIRTFYEQLSNNLFSMQGQVLGWATLSKSESHYMGGTNCTGNPYLTSNCNGIFSAAAIDSMQRGMAEALALLDPSVDWGQFDNDGPDGIPNSGDDDGIVDMAIFIHPTVDGACGGNNNIWSHRYVMLTPYTTHTIATGHSGAHIVVYDYTFQSGVGGATDTPCDGKEIMPIGTAAHESGHGLDLPDLYDVRYATEGIGEWGLMGSGNYTSPPSPSRMEAWSLQQMGWVALAPITAAGTYSVGPVETSDSAFLIRVQGSNPRGEYYLIENREAVLSDSALIRKHCQRSGNPVPCQGGLLIYHVDSEQVVNHGFHVDNLTNYGAIHGVSLLQADGLAQLENNVNRGDAGDPYPGTTGNTLVSYKTNPGLVKNSDGSFSGFTIDQIATASPNGPISFRLRFGGLTTIAASDPGALVQVDATNYVQFQDLLDSGTTHTINIASPQFSPSGRTRYTYVSWSDGGAESHSIVGSVAGATYTATVARSHRLDYATGANGQVNAPVATGTFVNEGTVTTVTAVPDSGFGFAGWSGDTAGNATLVLPMGRPFSVTASFASLLSQTTAQTRPNGVMGTAYFDTLRASGGNGLYSWARVAGSMPGLTLSANGTITGYPTAAGTFNFTARVTSQAQTSDRVFSYTVTEPTVAQAGILLQLLGSSGLTADNRRYLDDIGNSNGNFDVGDFLAWVVKTGATPAPIKPDATAVRMTRGGVGGRQ